MRQFDIGMTGPLAIGIRGAVSDLITIEGIPASRILANNQPDVLFHLFIYLFHLSTYFEHQVFIIGRSNCINTSSGMISLCK